MYKKVLPIALFFLIFVASAFGVSDFEGETTDLWGAWHFNGDRLDWFDSHDFSSNGTIEYGTNQRGEADGAIDFDGDGGFVYKGSIFWSAQTSYSFWMNITQESGDHFIIYKGKSSISSWSDIEIQLQMYGQYLRVSRSNGGGPVTNDVDYTGYFDEWHHVVITIDDSTDSTKVYIDKVKVLDSSTSFALNNPSSSYMAIGARQDNDYFLNGLVDELRVYESILSQSEVNALYDDFNALGDLTADFDYSVEYYSQFETDLNNTSETISLFDLNEFAWYVDGSLESSDENYYWIEASAGDYNVCLKATGYENPSYAQVVDWNCQTITLGFGSIELHFYDEDDNSVITPTLTRNGSTVTVTDGNYFETLDSGDSGIITFQATSSGYHERQWTWNVTPASDIDVDLYLLQSTEGVDIDFEFYDTDETTVLSNTLITAYINGNYSDGNFAERQYTDSTGNVTFFLQNDAAYKFYVEKESGSEVYEPAQVTTYIPKEETKLYNITPYNIDVGGLAVQSYTGLSANKTFSIYGNTEDNYQVTIDANDEYYERKYSFNVVGDTSTYSLYPYLSETNSSILSYLYVHDYYSDQTLEGVEVIVKKNIPGYGVSTVQSGITDSSGVVLFSFKTYDLYTLEFYYEGEFKKLATLVPIFTTYYAYLDTRDSSENPAQTIDVNVAFDPLNSLLAPTGDTFTLYQNIQTTSNFSSLNIHVYQGNTELYDVNYTSVGSGTYQHTFDVNSVESTMSINVVVTGVIGDNNFVFGHSYGLMNQSEYNIWNTLDDVKNNDLGEFGAILVALVITLMVVGWVASQGLGNIQILGFIAAIVLGLFTFIGWIPLFVYGIAVLGGAGAYLLYSRL